MNEWMIILIVLLSSGLFAAGGTDLDGKGHKWIRRFILPAGLLATSLFYAPWWASVAYSLTLCAFLHLGYGSKASWAYRSFIFAGYGLVSLWLGPSWWLIVTPVVCLGLFWLSNFKYTASSFTWKCVEIIYGIIIACSFVSAILNKW